MNVVNTKQAREAALDAELAALENPTPETPVASDPPIETKEDETWAERYSKLRSYESKKAEEFRRKEKEYENKLKELQGTLEAVQNPGIEFPKSVTLEEARAWVKEYPEIGGVLKAVVEEEVKDVKATNARMREELEQEKINLAKQRALSRIIDRHPDFHELSQKGSEFDQWLAEGLVTRGALGKFYYDAMYNNDDFDPDRSIDTLDAYKKSIEKKTRQPSKAPDGLSAPIPGKVPSAPENLSGKKQYLESEIENMDIREYERNEKEIEDARREGRITYDLTGAAR